MFVLNQIIYRQLYNICIRNERNNGKRIKVCEESRTADQFAIGPLFLRHYRELDRKKERAIAAERDVFYFEALMVFIILSSREMHAVFYPFAI